MLDHPTLDLLHELGLHGMAHGFRELAQNPESGHLQHGEWLAILLEHEATVRRQKRFEARARTARLRHAASVEDIDYHAQRGGSTARSSSSSPPVTGSASTAICLSPAPPGSARAGSLVRSATRPAARTSRCSISACPG